MRRDVTQPAGVSIRLSPRLVLVGAIVPACFAVLDHWLLSQMAIQSQSVFLTAVMLGAFVAQIGVLGVLCGRLIESPLLRGIIYGWCWVLVDLQTLTAATLSGQLGYWFNPTAILVTSLFAAQLGLVTIWAVLGTTWWVFRLPASLLLAVLVAVPLSDLGFHNTNLSLAFVVQTLVLLVICGVLRWQRFQLLRCADAPPAATRAGASEASRGALRSMQFGVRHVLIWTTSLAVMLAVARGFGLLSAAAAKSLLMQTGITTLSAGFLIAIVLVIALWAALGAGPAGLRWVLLGLASGLAGATLVVTNRVFDDTQFVLTFWDSRYWRTVAESDWWLIVWIALAGGMLFAALLIYRTLGYRLSRPAPVFRN